MPSEAEPPKRILQNRLAILFAILGPMTPTLIRAILLAIVIAILCILCWLPWAYSTRSTVRIS
jgi:hypothetical protein